MRTMTVSVLLVSMAFSFQAGASTYKADCLNEKGKFSNCKVEITGDTLRIDYNNDSYKSLTIAGNQIKSLSSGEYSRRRVAEAVLLTPWLLFSKKKRDQIGIEYTEGDTQTKATMIQVKKKYGLALKTELKALSGVEIQEK